MKTKYDKEVDELIRRALTTEEAAYYDRLKVKSPIHEAIQLYSGRNRWLNIYAMILTFLFVFGTVFCAIRFFEAEEVKELIQWSAGFLFCALAVSMLKIWAWMEMNKNSLHRELKRLEFQLATMMGSGDKEGKE